MMIVNNNGLTFDKWGYNYKNFIEEFINELPKYITVEKTCNKLTYKCMPYSINGLYTNGTTSHSWRGYKSFILKNGVAIGFYTNNSNYNFCIQNSKMNQTASGISYPSGTYNTVCGYIYVDLNGIAKPNTFDKDIFAFAVVNDGIVPMGSRQETIWNLTFSNQCLGARIADVNLGSAGKCTAWVIENGNMDYLHCKDKLSWDGPHSCKEAE